MIIHTSSNLIRVTNNRISASETVFPHKYLCFPKMSSHLSKALYNFFAAYRNKDESILQKQGQIQHLIKIHVYYPIKEKK